jgi:hypothetical protein
VADAAAVPEAQWLSCLHLEAPAALSQQQRGGAVTPLAGMCADCATRPVLGSNVQGDGNATASQTSSVESCGKLSGADVALLLHSRCSCVLLAEE